MHAVWKILGLAMTFAMASASPKNLGDYFSLCERSNADLSGCVVRSILDAKPRLSKGIPEMNLPPMEPLLIPLLENTEGSGNNQFSQKLSNVSIHGLSQFVIKECRVPRNLTRFYLDMFTPVITFDAQYEIHGRVLALPISGSGDCKLVFNEVRTIADVPISRVQRDGKEYLHADPFKWIIRAESGTVHFDNLFNGDEKLGETMNKFLNENWKDAFEAYKHLPEEAMGSVFTEFFNRVADVYPLDVMFPA
ncbi:protein takeout-like [Schistocerca piceifrons]|uniref:protein takeout-like n=1 Tax=Schistocerca piceifrons TaxID=274613 RepID=UPI001F5F687B|nr:protein takeout-like [Schistocerca piceifrons]